MRLDKFLADCGVGSRSEIKKMIRAGQITVAGCENPRPESKINEEKDEVYADGKRLVYRKYVYLMLNKPAGYLSATWDKHQPVVLDLLQEEYRHFAPFPVGRLDIDTEGLLILTNDGKLAHNLLSPTKHIPKVYYAKIAGYVDADDCSAFAAGVLLADGYRAQPAELKIIRSDQTSEVTVTLTEGKFHQVKRMFSSRGKPVLYLKRIRMNGLALDERLKPGEMRTLTIEELEMLIHGKCDSARGGNS